MTDYKIALQCLLEKSSGGKQMHRDLGGLVNLGEAHRPGERRSVQRYRPISSRAACAGAPLFRCARIGRIMRALGYIKRGNTVAGLDRDTKRTAVLASPLFQAMRPAELDGILKFSSERRIQRGMTIFQKGDTGDSMMAVLRGRVRISAISSDGKEITLNVINPGEVFGEIALLDGQPRSADASAIEDTTLLVVERRHLVPFLRANDDLYLRLLAVLCDRLRRTSMALESIALLDLPGRLARLLLKLAGDYGRPAPGGVRIDVKLSQRDLATLVASTRESVNKQLRVWREDGVLHLDGGYVVLRRPNELRALVE
jgi:CRP/FNR family cyclic AMP-dependent transcriptional regulator